MYGLTAKQFNAVGQLVTAAGSRSRPEATRPGLGPYPGACRVILFGDDDPTYTPKTLRRVGLFRLNTTGIQKTVEFTGHSLEGDLVLTIAGIESRVPCKSTTEELRAILADNGIAAKDCRLTVFPGLWEFDFNTGGRWSETPPAFNCQPFIPPDDDDETPVFGGELAIVDEAWVTVTTDGDTFFQIGARDWIPHAAGAVKSGSVGAGVWCEEAGWLVLAWQCRDFSFRADY